jgi:hypothetical protein
MLGKRSDGFIGNTQCIAPLSHFATQPSRIFIELQPSETRLKYGSGISAPRQPQLRPQEE